MERFIKKIQEQFEKMSKRGKLFRVKLSGSEIWQIYIRGFSDQEDPIFRDPESSTNNCNTCNGFVRRYGNIVSINENHEIETMFDIEIADEFKNVVKILTEKIKSSTIEEVFFETFAELNTLPYESCSKKNNVFKLGTDKNFKKYTKEECEKFGVVNCNDVYTFNHMHLFLDKAYVDMSGKSVEAIMGEYRDAKNVFQRAMETISLDTLNLVKDLINQGSLLDGKTHLYKVEQIIPLKTEYDNLPANQRNNWCWVKSFKLPFAKFRNELIGVLCSELSEGEELNKACQSWNKRVDPANYMKVTAPVTETMKKNAIKDFLALGYQESDLERRFATIDDIKASEILHMNVGKDVVKTVSVFDSVKSTSTRHKRSEFDGIESVSIEKFMKDILPGCTSVEAFLQNNHEGNMVSLHTSVDKDSKPLFKWDNPYSWTYNGNLAGKSMIKENVKAVGGKVTGILRASLQWNDEDTKGIIDFDLHCKTPFRKIYYAEKKDFQSGGWLDVDMINPSGIGIENVTWQNTLKDGTYKFFVHNYSGHKNHKGFKAEIEFDGNTFNYHYTQIFTGTVNVATVTVKKGIMTIEHHLPESSTSKEIYGLDTNQFHKVNLLCLSPNHWDGNSVGNKHYFFMLEKAKCPVSIRSFHAENLLPELAKNRAFFEVLGNTNMIAPTDKQLSGLGFNATINDELIVKLQGTFKRTIKILFNN